MLSFSPFMSQDERETTIPEGSRLSSCAAAAVCSLLLSEHVHSHAKETEKIAQSNVHGLRCDSMSNTHFTGRNTFDSMLPAIVDARLQQVATTHFVRRPLSPPCVFASQEGLYGCREAAAALQIYPVARVAGDTIRH
jgi:hypothetical protein